MTKYPPHIMRQYELDVVKALLTILLVQKLITTKEFIAMCEEHERITADAT